MNIDQQLAALREEIYTTNLHRLDAAFHGEFSTARICCEDMSRLYSRMIALGWEADGVVGNDLGP